MWRQQISKSDRLMAVNLEVTARCNNNCRHCYINLPADDHEARERELSFQTLKDIADQACSLGALWCLITGGEPLLRKDFEEIYIYLKKKGMLVSVFTNATLIDKEHIALFKKWPPRDIEISVYGVTAGIYEAVTRRPGSFKAFMRGLNLLSEAGIPVNLKAMVMQSNRQEFGEIARFCRQRSRSEFRFDPLLHLRYDHDQKRNMEIREERLTASEIALLEQSDAARLTALKNACAQVSQKSNDDPKTSFLFACGAGINECTVGHDGKFRLCASLTHPDCLYDLTNGSLKDAVTRFVYDVRGMRSNHGDFLQNCAGCTLVSLCHWCPAHAYLETGRLDGYVPYFCDVARARAQSGGEREVGGQKKTEGRWRARR